MIPFRLSETLFLFSFPGTCGSTFTGRRIVLAVVVDVVYRMVRGGEKDDVKTFHVFNLFRSFSLRALSLWNYTKEETLRGRRINEQVGERFACCSTVGTVQAVLQSGWKEICEREVENILFAFVFRESA